MITLIGDVHCHFKELLDKIILSNPFRSSFIQVGDFGLGYSNKDQETSDLADINSTLKNTSNHLYIIRGNHDDPVYFQSNSLFSNITFLKDYSFIKIDGLAILLAGGAISINRKDKIKNGSYHSDEGFLFNETWLKNSLEGIKKIDIVVTHSAPGEFLPTEVGKRVIPYLDDDPSLLADMRKERYRHSQLLDLLITNKLKPRYWYYGHFHESHYGNYKGIKYRALDALEFWNHN